MRRPPSLVGQTLCLDPVAARNEYETWVRWSGWREGLIDDERPGDPQLHKFERPGVATLKYSGGLAMHRYSFWGDEILYSDLATGIASAVSDLAVARLVVQLETPGGFMASQLSTGETIRRLTATRKIPIDVHTQGRCLSAGAIIASAICANGGRITAEGPAEVGMIGVYKLYTFVGAMLEKAGIDVRYVSAGAHKIDLFPEMAPDDAAFARAQSQINELYELICRTVGTWRADSRGIGPDEGYALVRAQESQTYIGNEEAIDAGVIDAVATLEQVLDEAAAAV